MSKVTPPGPAGAVRLTVKVKLVVPALPSPRVTSLIDRPGVTGPPPCGVRAKSSTARPSSAPLAFKSFQRIQKVAPLAIERLAIELLTAVRLAAALPSRAPAVPAVLIGLVKSSALTSVQAPVAR